MSATTFGTYAKHGITSAESGILIQSISYNYSQEKYPTKNHQGETVGMTMLDEKVEVKLNGWIPSSGVFSNTLAASLALTNAIPDHLKGAVTGGSLLIDEISREASNEGAETIEISATYWPLITA